MGQPWAQALEPMLPSNEATAVPGGVAGSPMEGAQAGAFRKPEACLLQEGRRSCDEPDSQETTSTCSLWKVFLILTPLSLGVRA